MLNFHILKWCIFLNNIVSKKLWLFSKLHNFPGSSSHTPRYPIQTADFKMQKHKWFGWFKPTKRLTKIILNPKVLNQSLYFRNIYIRKINVSLNSNPYHWILCLKPQRAINKTDKSSLIIIIDKTNKGKINNK